MNIKQKFIYSYILLVLVYALGILLLPPDTVKLHKYNLTVTHMRVIDLAIVVMFAAIWFCAIYGFYNLVVYSNMIRKNKDGKSISKITIGIGFLSLWLPISSIISTYGSYLTQMHQNWTPAVGIVQNYISLLVPLIGFVYISMGARGLSDLTKQRPTLRATNILAIIVIVIGVIYVHLVSATQNLLNGEFRMPEYFILLTLVAPYIYMWYIGLLSVYEIYIFRTKIGGVVYRACWKKVSWGLATIVIALIFVQYLSTLSMRITKLSLDWVLMLIFVLLIILAVGFVFIALGVRNLKKIEEV